MGRHFYSYEQCRRGLDSDGNERDYWSLHQFNANTLIGKSIGRICNGLSAWWFNLRHKNY